MSWRQTPLAPSRVLLFVAWAALPLPVLSQELIFLADGDSDGDNFGWSVDSAGDVDGDGFADVIIGARTDDKPANGSGSAWVYSGATGSLIHLLSGQGTNEQFGAAVSGAGDLNGDGFDDLLVGASTATTAAGTQSGLVRAFSGADGSLLWEATGSAAFDQFGSAVSELGDWNADGAPDVLASAPDGTFFGVEFGYVRVLSGMDGSILLNFFGSFAADDFGSSLAAGDVNADSVEDAIIGAPGAFLGAPGGGSVIVISGATGATLLRIDGDAQDINLGFSVAFAGDTDGDGFGDFVGGAPHDLAGGIRSGSARVYSGADGSLLFRVDGENSSQRLGFSVGGAGDVDGDGLGDVILGSPDASRSFLQAGSAQVHSGGDGRLLFLVSGGATLAFLGYSVAGAGDVDADGFADVIVGEPSAARNGIGSGGARVFSGRPRMIPSATAISAAAGSTTTFPIDFPVSEAGRQYALLASASQNPLPTTPGGATLPLSDQDPLFQLLVGGGAPPQFVNAFGTLDAAGDATAQLVLAPGDAAAYVGQTLFFSAVAYLPPRDVRAASAAVALRVDP